MLTLGFDTSNYTTSCAWFDGTNAENFSRLLDVRPGELGLRQSDALFSHIKRLPELSDRLFAHLTPDSIRAIGVSSRPRAVEGSYMPCFLAGESQASVLSEALHVPLYKFSHQQGHIAAALWSAGRMELMQKPHLAWHLSGGTTELLLVTPDHKNIHAEKIGGTMDISAGQLIDRTGSLLSMPFPSGKWIDRAAEATSEGEYFRVKVNHTTFSLSGVQNQIQAFYKHTTNASATAAYCILSLVHAIRKATINALKEYHEYPVVFSGGVSSNSILRKKLSDIDAIFASPEFSTDNALGIALLAYLQEE